MDCSPRPQKRTKRRSMAMHELLSTGLTAPDTPASEDSRESVWEETTGDTATSIDIAMDNLDIVSTPAPQPTPPLAYVNYLRASIHTGGLGALLIGGGLFFCDVHIPPLSIFPADSGRINLHTNIYIYI